MGLFKNCKETSVLVTRSLDGELSLLERIAMRVHLLICRNCALFMKQMRQMRSWLRNESEPGQQALTEQARERIVNRLRKEE